MRSAHRSRHRGGWSRFRGLSASVAAVSLGLTVIWSSPVAGIGPPLPSFVPSLPVPVPTSEVPFPTNLPLPLPTKPPTPPPLPLPSLPVATLPPLPSLPLPTLPVPSVPVPSVPVPSLPLPSKPNPSLPLPSNTVPSLPVGSGVPLPSLSGSPGSTTGPGESGLSPDPLASPLAGELVDSSAGGGAAGAPGSTTDGDQGSPFSFALPLLIAGIPIALIALIVLAQVAGGAAWLPVIRRWRNRRLTPDA